MSGSSRSSPWRALKIQVLLNLLDPGSQVLHEAAGSLIGHPDLNLKTLVLTSRENSELVKEAEEAGVDGLVFRSGIGLCGEGSFLQAILTVARGGVWLSPAVSCIVNSGADKDALATISELTDKERAVLTQVARGLDNNEIATELFISEETCKSHLRSIRQKVGETDRVKLALLAIKAGI